MTDHETSRRAEAGDPEREPSADELLAMAYADGELEPAQARELERRMEHDPTLVHDVAQHLRIAVLARQAAGPEPADFEWRRLERETTHALGLKLGWILFALGVLVLVIGAAWELGRSENELWLKLSIGAIAVGLGIVLALTLRARLRTLRYDPYRDIER